MARQNRNRSPENRCPNCGQYMRLDMGRQKAVVAAYRGGGTLAEVGREFGLSHVYVLEILQRAGVPRRPRGRPREK